MALWVFRHETSTDCPSECPFHSDIARNKLLSLRRGCHKGGWVLEDPVITRKALSLFSTLYGHLSCSACTLSHAGLSVTPWIVAHQASLSLGFSRQEYWSGLPSPSSGDLPDPGIEPTSPALAGGLFATGPPGKLVWVPKTAIRLFANKNTSFTSSFLVRGPEGWCFKIRWNQMQAFNSKKGVASAAVWGDDDLSPLKINMATCLY